MSNGAGAPRAVKPRRQDASHQLGPPAGPGQQRVAPLSCRLCGFEPFFDPRGDQYMYSRILTCDYEFVSPWWDEVSLNAKDLVSEAAPGLGAAECEAFTACEENRTRGV